MEQIKEIQVDLAEHYPTLKLNPNLYLTLTLTIELLLQKQKLKKKSAKKQKEVDQDFDIFAEEPKRRSTHQSTA